MIPWDLWIYWHLDGTPFLEMHSTIDPDHIITIGHTIGM